MDVGPALMAQFPPHTASGSQNISITSLPTGEEDSCNNYKYHPSKQYTDILIKCVFTMFLSNDNIIYLKRGMKQRTIVKYALKKQFFFIISFRQFNYLKKTQD